MSGSKNSSISVWYITMDQLNFVASFCYALLHDAIQLFSTNLSLFLQNNTKEFPFFVGVEEC